MVQNQEKIAKLEPTDPYECWITSFSNCVFWHDIEKKCLHPEALLWEGNDSNFNQYE